MGHIAVNGPRVAAHADAFLIQQRPAQGDSISKPHSSMEFHWTFENRG
jgi:hypothetical protein